MSSLLAFLVLTNATDAKEKKRKEELLPFREVSLLVSFVIAAGYYHILKSKFTCPQKAVPSHTGAFGFKH